MRTSEKRDSIAPLARTTSVYLRVIMSLAGDNINNLSLYTVNNTIGFVYATAPAAF